MIEEVVKFDFLFLILSLLICLNWVDAVQYSRIIKFFYDWGVGMLVKLMDNILLP